MTLKTVKRGVFLYHKTNLRTRSKKEKRNNRCELLNRNNLLPQHCQYHLLDKAKLQYINNLLKSQQRLPIPHPHKFKIKLKKR